MDAGVWALVAMSIALVLAGAVAWWLAHGCVVTTIGAAGSVLAGVASILCLALLLDPGTAISLSLVLTAVGGAWLLSWAIAGGIRGQRLDRARAVVASHEEPQRELHHV